MTAAHILVKEADPDDPEDFRYRIECQIEGGCGGWWECDKPHEVDGRCADADLTQCGPFDCVPDAPWEGQVEFTFHGVVHTWHDGHGWTVPHVGCIVAVVDWMPPEEVEDLPPGRYEVTDEWDDTELYLEYVGPEVS